MQLAVQAQLQQCMGGSIQASWGKNGTTGLRLSAWNSTQQNFTNADWVSALTRIALARALT